MSDPPQTAQAALPNAMPNSSAATVAPVHQLDPSKLKGSKRPRRPPPPCHDEIQFVDNEYINCNSDKRLQGSSAHFDREKYKFIPLDDSLKTKDDLVDVAVASVGSMPSSWDTVVAELYKKKMPTPTSPVRPPDPDEAFVVTFDNDRKPQYYLLELKKATTLFHIQDNGQFWGYAERNDPDPTIGEKLYTKGFVWTSPDPTWVWKTAHGARRVNRVRIDVPPGTQLLMDRAPVSKDAKECQFVDGRKSITPDVLLAPAEFEVTGVVRYRPLERKDEDSKEEQRLFTYVKPRGRRTVDTDIADEEYAAFHVFNCDEFMDVRVQLTRQLKLPPVESIAWDS